MACLGAPPNCVKRRKDAPVIVIFLRRHVNGLDHKWYRSRQRNIFQFCDQEPHPDAHSHHEKAFSMVTKKQQHRFAMDYPRPLHTEANSLLQTRAIDYARSDNSQKKTVGSRSLYIYIFIHLHTSAFFCTQTTTRITQLRFHQHDKRLGRQLTDATTDNIYPLLPYVLCM